MSTRRSRAPLAGAAACALALLAACSPGTTDSGGDSAGSGSASPAGGALADVRADVEKAMAPRDSFDLPTDPVDVTALKGKTVYYIPLTAQISVFQLYGSKLGEALDAAGVHLQICDGGANPSQIAGCIDQAVGASAAAIVADNVPYGMAGNAFDAARAKKIPVLIANQIPDKHFPVDTTLAYIPGPTTDMI